MLIGAEGRIDQAVAAHNLAGATATRYLIDPQDHIAARREARQRGLAVVGFYHSHPSSRAWPSSTDIAEANYADAVYVIVSLERDPADVRGFRIEEGHVIEVSLETELV